MVVNVDSETVVRLLEDEGPCSSPYIHIIRKCKALIQRDEWEIKISHCYREANRAAGWLANYGVSLTERFAILEAVPKDLHVALLKDLSGVAWPRWVASNDSQAES